MLPALSALLVHSRETLTRFGFRAETFLLLESYRENGTREKVTRRGASGGTVAIAYIDPRLVISIAAQVKQRRGLANPESGAALSWTALSNYLTAAGAPEDHLGFIAGTTGDPTYGKLIVEDPVYEQPAANKLHHITLNISHEFASWSGHTHTDPDGDGTGSIATDPETITIIPPSTDTEPPVDPETGYPPLRTVRIYYAFTPAPGSTRPARTGYVTRIISSATPATTASIYATVNPPAATWQSTPTTAPDLTDGPAWDDTDPTATPAPRYIAGTYVVEGIYELESNTWISAWIGTGSAPTPYDTATHGDCITVTTFLDGTQHLLIGNLPNTASVLTALGLADTTTISRITCPRTHDAYFGTPVPGTDDLGYWRITTTQPKAPGYLQIAQVYGQRTTTNFNFLRVSYDKFDIGYAYLNSDFPNPPPPQEYNIGTANAHYLLDSIDAVYHRNISDYALGDAAAVTALSYPAPATGKDLWTFTRGTGYGALAGTTTYLVGNYPDLASFCSHYSLTNTTANLNSKFTWLYHANGSEGKGRYYVGTTASVADPLNVVGISRY